MQEDTPPAGFTVWFTGLPAAGKSTLARGLHASLSSRGRRVELLDGDEVRALINTDLGFSQQDRDENVRRVGAIARTLAGNGAAVIVAVISPSAAVRAEVRKTHENRFIEVFVDCPLNVRRARDPKGLYRRAEKGEISEFTGVSAPYDVPVNPDIHLYTDRDSATDCVDMVISRLRELGLA